MPHTHYLIRSNISAQDAQHMNRIQVSSVTNPMTGAAGMRAPKQLPAIHLSVWALYQRQTLLPGGRPVVGQKEKVVLAQIMDPTATLSQGMHSCLKHLSRVLRKLVMGVLDMAYHRIVHSHRCCFHTCHKQGPCKLAMLQVIAHC